MSLKGIDVTRPGIRAFALRLVLCLMSPLLASSSSFAANPLKTPSELTKADEERGIFTNYDISNVKIPTFDALLLDGRVYEPKLSAYSGRRPAIIFTNSWTLGEYEYETQARKFAARGYIVLSYSSRGFGGSEGYVTVGGPNDVSDFTTVVDWLEDNTRVDVANIGMAGVSLGGGLSLLALANEPRIKTAASLSGWGNLEQSLYRNETIQKTWMKILISSGTLLGHLDPDLHEQVVNMENRTDIVATRAWAARRSVDTLIQQINDRKAPVFLENSYLDALFPPAQIRPFYDSLEGVKRMIADEGIHASSSISGLLGLKSELWDELHDWMDHWLVDSGRPIKTGITFRTRGETGTYQSFPELNYRSTPFKPLKPTETDAVSGRSILSFQGNRDSGATSGIPIISDSLDSYINVPVKKKIADIDERYAAVFETTALTQKLKVRGSPRLSFTLMPHTSPVTLVGYLYDVDRNGVGALVAFSVMSVQDPNAAPNDVEFDLNMTAFEVPKGHKLVVALDTVDPLYTGATNKDYKVSLAADPALSLELPLVP